MVLYVTTFWLNGFYGAFFHSSLNILRCWLLFIPVFYFLILRRLSSTYFIHAAFTLFSGCLSTVYKSSCWKAYSTEWALTKSWSISLYTSSISSSSDPYSFYNSNCFLLIWATVIFSTPYWDFLSKYWIIYLSFPFISLILK